MNSQLINSRDMHWAEQIRNDNQAAFTNLFDEYYSPLCEYVYRYVRDDEVMEDIVQDVFVRIWEKRKNWSPKVAVRAYLYRSVYNQAITCFRKKRFETPMEDNISSKVSGHELSPLDEFHNNEIDQAIKAVINELPERRREILVLRMLHDLSYKEIGATLDISVNTVDTQLRRALKLLRERLKQFLPEYEPARMV